MNLQDVIIALNLTPLTAPEDFSQIVPSGGYTSDLLSCVMAGAAHGSLWITLQGHLNVVAVAALLDLSGVILTEGVQPEANVIERANQQGVRLFSTPMQSYDVVGRLWEMGLRN